MSSAEITALPTRDRLPLPRQISTSPAWTHWPAGTGTLKLASLTAVASNRPPVTADKVRTCPATVPSLDGEMPFRRPSASASESATEDHLELLSASNRERKREHRSSRKPASTALRRP